MSIQSEVIAFVAEFCGVDKSRVSLDTLVNDELGVDGVDGAELLAGFSEKFNVNLEPIKDVYFGPEGFNPFTAIFQGIAAFVSGIQGKPDIIRPLPVRLLVKSAEEGKWVDN